MHSNFLMGTLNQLVNGYDFVQLTLLLVELNKLGQLKLSLRTKYLLITEYEVQEFDFLPASFQSCLSFPLATS